MSAGTEFMPDRGAYLRSHTTLAAVAMGGAMLVLWLIGERHIWAGAVAALAAIGVRGWYLASEELSAAWRLTDTAVAGPGGQSVPLAQIVRVRSLGNFVQIITRDGMKYLIKYQADPAATTATLRRAAGLPAGAP